MLLLMLVFPDAGSNGCWDSNGVGSTRLWKAFNQGVFSRKSILNNTKQAHNRNIGNFFQVPVSIQISVSQYDNVSRLTPKYDARNLAGNQFFYVFLPLNSIVFHIDFTFIFLFLAFGQLEFSQFQTNLAMWWRWIKILILVIPCRRISVKGLSMNRGKNQTNATSVIIHPTCKRFEKAF